MGAGGRWPRTWGQRFLKKGSSENFATLFWIHFFLSQNIPPKPIFSYSVSQQNLYSSFFAISKMFPTKHFLSKSHSLSEKTVRSRKNTFCSFFLAIPFYLYTWAPVVREDWRDPSTNFLFLPIVHSQWESDKIGRRFRERRRMPNLILSLKNRGRISSLYLDLEQNGMNAVRWLWDWLHFPFEWKKASFSACVLRVGECEWRKSLFNL